MRKNFDQKIYESLAESQSQGSDRPPIAALSVSLSQLSRRRLRRGYRRHGLNMSGLPIPEPCGRTQDDPLQGGMRDGISSNETTSEAVLWPSTDSSNVVADFSEVQFGHSTSFATPAMPQVVVLPLRGFCGGNYHISSAQAGADDYHSSLQAASEEPLDGFLSPHSESSSGSMYEQSTTPCPPSPPSITSEFESKFKFSGA